MISKDRLTKRYYTIGEVSQKIGESPSLLRYWETVFTVLKPRKDKSGVRRYTAEDVILIDEIHYLVKKKGFTLEGARQALGRRKHLKKILNRLQGVRQGLIEIRNQLSSDKFDDPGA